MSSTGSQSSCKHNFFWSSLLFLRVFDNFLLFIQNSMVEFTTTTKTTQHIVMLIVYISFYWKTYPLLSLFFLLRRCQGYHVKKCIKIGNALIVFSWCYYFSKVLQIGSSFPLLSLVEHLWWWLSSHSWWYFVTEENWNHKL